MGDQRQGQLTAGETLHQFVGAFVDELARSGVGHVCLCPGSRSTPLALLLRRHPAVRVWTHLDERSAAFFALGMAKALREPVAVLSTSGTAAVNFAPAVVEAYYARVPLLVLTADRPPDLRGVGAPQTIDQVRLYGPHVKWFVEMLLPEASPEALRYARTVACRAAATARADAAGPVHVNFPFREPLIPAGQGLPPGRDGAFSLTDEGAPYVSVAQAPRRPDPADLAPLAKDLLAADRGLIVCGPQDDPDFPQAVARLAEGLGFPLLADPLSQVRCGPHHGPHVIDSYDAFLRDEATSADLAPEVVLRFSGTPVSKALLLYLQRHGGCRQILVDGGGGWSDPALTASDVLHADPLSFCEALLVALRSSGPRRSRAARADWARRWQATAQRARAGLRRRLAEEPGLSEPGVLAELAGLLPAGATLFAGNSMPVRDLDLCFPGAARPIRFLANRGASGIDGVVSTALGASAVSTGPLVLAIGDLSFYHDMNGLLAVRRHNLSATVVLLNNDGGGIFSFLSQAEEGEHFEELFGTPHGLDFRPAAELYGLDYRRVESWEEFRGAIQQSMGAPGVGLVEVRTDRQANVRLHRELWAAASEAVRAAAQEATAP
ncbi:MAG: 2-succinyl-5-enolpyruvyl-6-hydroxy-3-cyclohexene-1-carboxylic-acid synthase [Chloroflexi bacterium RBG_16_68_14]|nr:MAG: 2-succinyl-5-enolpyruvyl-6-hydroxy-3-cyclohexene-1-carboxylic-acid synthase [Chloroflexi bacterium RBG_16_68_14]